MSVSIHYFDDTIDEKEQRSRNRNTKIKQTHFNYRRIQMQPIERLPVSGLSTSSLPYRRTFSYLPYRINQHTLEEEC
jgi:hypothetical protein